MGFSAALWVSALIHTAYWQFQDNLQAWALCGFNGA